MERRASASTLPLWTTRAMICSGMLSSEVAGTSGSGSDGMLGTFGAPAVSIEAPEDGGMANVFSPIEYSSSPPFSRVRSATMFLPFFRWMVSACTQEAALRRIANRDASREMKAERSTAGHSSNAFAAFLLLALVLPLASPCSAYGQRLDAADLYRRLATVHLDAQQVYTIRDGSITREDVHLTFDDGTIAFMKAVDGHVTGALFLGEGQVLVVPPNQTERQSLSLFTGAAVLSERISVAYLRFSDDRLFDDLKPALRPLENGERSANEFLAKYDPVVS